MPARTKFKLSAVALGEINDACESLEKRWQRFEELNSPPDFRDLIADFDSKALDDIGQIKYELTRELIEADILFRQANGVAVPKAAYSEMLALHDESVLDHFNWDELAGDNGADDLSFVVQQNAVEALHETQTITPDASGLTGAVSAIRPAIQPSGQIGHYKLLQKIGEGGMGTVWMAEQDKPVRRRVALKLIKSELASKEIIARFEAERQALAMMDHPNIARVLDAGTTETGNPYFVMELIKGTPLNEYCDKHELSIKDRLQIMVDVCEAVQHAHQKGILHRDLKPSNVLVSEVNGKPVP
ncbi:serine/threonine protein kinase, partial [Mariniblastus sp.]|nr:serine/threonine protein kinase [Mariniblastus sp.]